MQDIDLPPIYDPVTVNGDLMSSSMQSWLGQFIQTLSEYLSSNGIFIPRITTLQRDLIKNPGNMMIYNTTVEAPQIYQNGTWKTFTTV